MPILTVVISSSVITPIVSGLAAIAVAIIAASYQRKENLKATRIKAYGQLENALGVWAAEKTLVNAANLHTAANIVRIVGSEKTAEFAAEISYYVENHRNGIGRETMPEFLAIRQDLMKSMRSDIGNT